MSVTVKFDPNATNIQSAVIPNATERNDGVMSKEQVTQLNNLVKGSVDEVTATAPITSTGGNTPNIGITPATALAAGSMSAADKAKLDGMSPGAAVASVSGTAPITSTGGNTPAIGITPATTLAAGSMSAADKAKADALASGVYLWTSTKTWAQVYAEMLAVNPTEPGGIVLVDRNFAFTVPAGTYDLSRTVFRGLWQSSAITFAAGALWDINTTSPSLNADFDNIIVLFNGTHIPGGHTKRVMVRNQCGYLQQLHATDPMAFASTLPSEVYLFNSTVTSSGGAILACSTGLGILSLSGTSPGQNPPIPALPVVISFSGAGVFTVYTDPQNAAVAANAYSGVPSITRYQYSVMQDPPLPVTFGTSTPAAGTIAPTKYMTIVSGAGVISTITPPAEFTVAGAGVIGIVPAAGSTWTMDTAGNIGKAVTAVPGQLLWLVWNAATGKWYPSY